MIVETARTQLSLRRYSNEGVCPLTHSYHNESKPLGVVSTIYGVSGGRRVIEPRPEQIAHDDPRWPVQCACGEPFTEKDTWQIFQDGIWSRPDTGEELTLRQWQKVPGAMWDAWWYHTTWVGPDGLSLVVALPDGREWLMDGPAKGSNRPWTRTGVPPIVTATPSILTPGYHGWLRDGVLVPC
jgi:hypothetical protein